MVLCQSAYCYAVFVGNKGFNVLAFTGNIHVKLSAFSLL